MSNVNPAASNDVWMKVYQTFKPYTMISEGKYLDTLQLVHDWSTTDRKRGDIVECGVWRGGMIGGIATVLGDVGIYHLFDSFQGLPPAKEIDGALARAWQQDTTGPMYHNNCRAEIDEAKAAMAMTPVKSCIHVGWFDETFPKSDVCELCLLRLDGDWYDSTMLSLESFYPRLQEGGLLLIDDYYIWDGCCRAVHDYLSRIKSSSRIRSVNQVCYVIKTEKQA